ncbi:MAG: threonine--tRNA ligase [Elusimicrobia bacterium]|nr:threonine--tRNA ligase [Elusimicrobiota bacterium]MBU2614101.1 threonine--tRNA ligase [Elusimicrobiota bacterium]
MENLELEKLRHSTSHVMAQSVSALFPGTKFAIGPSIENGFYYDFDSPARFMPEDLLKIEKRMKDIITNKLEFIKKDVSKQEAIDFFSKTGQKYKIELINDIPGETVTFYQQGSFTDLCRGPHVKSTSEIKYFKLLSVAGAYWRGDEKREQLQRIYGTAFLTKEELDKYLAFLEEAKARDHRKLGKELDLFSIQDEVGAGLILWHPKGALMRKIIEDFWKNAHLKNGYQLLNTPHIAHLELWNTSGHTNFYKENMFSSMDVDGQDYQIKPMNCPFHILVYKTHLRSYRDLPIRYAELGTVYRYERSGVLHGLMRVRGFTQDDAHIYCRPGQLENEIKDVIKFVIYILKTFGFENYEIFLSTRPEKYTGELSDWEKATNALKIALENLNLPYRIDPGEGVFYGPKIDLKIKDCLGRSWQCSTIQIDFNLPKAFNMEYMNEQSQPEKPVMIHRALMGSLERFFGVLIEHYAGAFPLWLAPVQAKVISISDKAQAYANEVNKQLLNSDIRSEADTRNETLGYKIREATMSKIPYVIVVGEKEIENKKISVRTYGSKVSNETTVSDFISLLTSK